MDGRRWATYVTREGPSPERSHQVNLKGAPSSMRKHRYIALTALFALVVSACNAAASPSPSSAPAATPAASASAASSAEPSASAAAASPTALAPDPAEAVITGVEANAEIGFWTFYLSPTFDQYIKDTIARFEATYPGVTVKWEDHQATFQADLNNAFNAEHRPRRHQPVGQRGLGQRLRRQGPAPRPQQRRPEAGPGHLLPRPLERAAGRRRELPVPVVPGSQRRADQQEDLRGGRRPQRRRLPQDDRRTAGCLPDHQGQDRHPVRHPPDRQRPAVADGLRGRRRRHQ